MVGTVWNILGNSGTKIQPGQKQGDNDTTLKRSYEDSIHTLFSLPVRDMTQIQHRLSYPGNRALRPTAVRSGRCLCYCVIICMAV